MYQKTFGESAGLVLRKIANVLWFFLPIIVIVFSIIFSMLPSYETSETETNTQTEMTAPTFPALKVEKCIVYDVNYYDYSNYSTFSLMVKFNQNVYAGTATVEFYDAQNKLLETSVLELELENYGNYGTTLKKSYINVDGKVASAKISSFADIESAEMDIYNKNNSHNNTYDDTYHDDTYYDDTYYYALFSLCIIWAFLRCIYIYPLVITALFFNCKSYEINGHCIVVYSGRLHNYIKVNGRKIDEKNVLLPFHQLWLNATLDTGEYIEVHIPAVTKRFTLRSNGVLQNPTKIK